MKAISGQIDRPRVCVLIVLSALLAGVLSLPVGPSYAAAVPLQIGWYTGAGISNMARIDTQKAAGETLQFAYYVSNPSSYLTKLQQAGVKTFLELDSAAVNAGNTAAITSFVNTYKNQPAVAGWYLYDEPDLNGVWASTLVTDYQAIKAVDPNHPVALSFGDGYCSYVGHNIDSNYFNAADIILFPGYPIADQPEFGTTVDGRHSMGNYPYIVTDCMSYVGGLGKTFMMIAQGFNWGGTGPSGALNRDPTYGEERYFTFMPFIHNVAGLLYWVDYRADTNLTAAVHQVMKEASSLGPALGSGIYKDPSVSVNNTGISYKYGSDGTNTYLIAENDTESSITAAFTLPASANVSRVTVLYDDYNATTQSYTPRNISTSTGTSGRATFSDTFTKYQVHIYQLAVGASNQSPTATATNTPVPPTATRTNTAVPPTATATNTPVLPTATRTNTAVPPSATATNTPIPPTATRTNTAVPPTATATNTPVPPTATRINTVAPSSIPPTNTMVPPTATATNKPLSPTATNTPTPSPISGSPTNPPTQIIQSDNRAVRRAGRWMVKTTSAASGGSYMYSSGSRNDALSLSFVGTSLDVIYVKNPNLGTFAVMVDGVKVLTVSSSTAQTTFNVHAPIRNLTPGSHTVRVYSVTGVIAIDAFAMPPQPSRRQPYIPPASR